MAIFLFPRPGGEEVVSAEPQEVQQLGVAQLSQPFLSAAEYLLRQLPLGLQHLVNFLLYGPITHQLVYHDVFRLPDTEGPVGGLVLHRRIPPTVEVDHMAGLRQIRP